MKYIIFFLLLSLSAAGQQEFFHAQNKGLLLDEYPNAAAAYSLRRVNSRYTGPLIRVRRDSTGQAEQDIGSIGEALDTVALKAFVRNNSGFVTTWYDQSGNARNATQTTAASQPRIVNAGVVEKDGSKVGVRFFRANNTALKTAAALFTGAQARSVYAVYTPLSTTINLGNDIWGQQSGSTPGTWCVLQFRQAFGANGDPYFAGYFADLTDGSNITTVKKIASFFYDGTTASLYRNSTLVQSAARALNTVNVQFTIGGTPEAFISEIIVYNSSQLTFRNQLIGNINSYYAIY